MNFFEIAKSRFSCRNYKSDEIDEKKIIEIMEAVQVAPSAVNFQPWHFIIANTRESKEKIYEAYPRDWIKTAPVIIVACGDHTVSWKRNDGKDYLDIDVCIAIDHLTLQATDKGLATCWVCNFNTSILKQNLMLPINIEPIAIIPLGYPNEKCDVERHHSKRKKIEEFVHWESFSSREKG